MTRRGSEHPLARAKSAAVVTYLSLAAFYVGSLLITSRTVGPDMGGAFLTPAFTWSVLARLVGGITCLAIVGILMSRSPRRNVAGTLAWGLVLGVTGTLIMDGVLNGPTSGLLWLIAAATVALHMCGAVWTRRAIVEAPAQ